MDDDDRSVPRETHELFLRVADKGAKSLYLVEHWFFDLPEAEPVADLFEEAKQAFARLYPEAEAVDFSVELRRLRPKDDYRPDFRPLM